ncbi:MAG: ATP-binding protein [Burkholderiaceae bacterium]|nr:ATP-binding protein [Burkholderiaceae bacterium]
MTLRRRLLMLLLAAAPLVWLITLLLTVLIARKEINELFDTQQVRLAQQVLVILPAELAPDGAPHERPPPLAGLDPGEAELKDMAIAVVSSDGRLLLTDREGAQLPLQAAPGFSGATLDGQGWRIYTLVSRDGRWRVVVGQAMEERDELLADLLASQALPGLLALPLLLAAMAWAVQRALRPLEALRDDLQSRAATDLQPLHAAHVPGELQPLVTSMNALLARIEQALAHERRVTADAAHELRTPLAALRAQWEAAQAATDSAVRGQAQKQVGAVIERLSHLVDQLLQLARAEGEDAARVGALAPIDWQRVIESALSDCLPLMEARGSDVEVDWPDHGIAPLPLTGSDPLMTTLLRNLIDNALRYSPPGATVRVRLTGDALLVEDNGPGLGTEELARLGDRFYRPPGQAQTGSGLGVSIVRRIAELHGLAMHAANRPSAEGSGLRVVLRRD